jgi:hypothetical protein
MSEPSVRPAAVTRFPRQSAIGFREPPQTQRRLLESRA